MKKGKIISFCLSFVFALYPCGLLGRAAELAEITERGYLKIAVKDNLRPLSFRDASGNLQGLEIEIARRLAEELLGSPDAVELQPVTNQNRLKVVLEGNVDLAIARVTATGSRRRVVDFSLPYYLDGTALVTRKAAVQRLNDLAFARIAALDLSSTVANLRYILPTAELVAVNSYQEARSLLESGGADAFAADASILSGWVQEYPDYHLLPTLLSAEPLCIVMPKGLHYEELRQRVNAAIARWQTEGWLRERIIYWGLPLTTE